MKIPISELQVDEQVVIISQIMTIHQSEDSELDGDADFFIENSTIDFDVFTNKENSFKITLDFTFNNVDKPSPGYSMNILSEGYFTLNPKNKETDLIEAANYSGLSMMIAFLRNHIKITTNSMGFGEFVLPAIYLQGLIDTKYQKS